MATSSLYSVREIGKDYNDQMLKILHESPVESGGLTICFDRSPDIFLIPELKSEYYKCAGFFRKDELVGFAMLLYFEAYINSKPELITYYCNMYIKQEFRGKGFYFRASDFLFSKPYNNAKLGYTIIMKGNKAAESHIGRTHPRFPSIPYSKLISVLEARSIIITFRKRENKEYKVRQAQHGDIDRIVSLLQDEFSGRLFAPFISRKKFVENLDQRPDFDISNYYLAEKDGYILGVCAVWDTKAIKQNRIIRYSRSFKWTKTIYSLGVPVFKFPSLPKEGGSFKDAAITEYAVKDRNPKIMESLITRIYNDYREKQYNTVIFGSCSNDPLLESTNKFFYQSVFSNIVLASTDKSFIDEDKIDINLPFVDVATL